MSLHNSFRAARWLRSTNLVLQAILFVTLFAGLNYLALHFTWRFDLTQFRRHSLSAETRAYLTQLNKPIRIINTFPATASENDADTPANLPQIKNDINGLLREYTYAIESNAVAKLTIEHIDVYQRPREAEQLDLKPNTLFFMCGERRHTITLSELYRYKDKQRVAFLGEQAITSAILDVSSTEQKKIYFLTGHGEMDPYGVDLARGLSELRVALGERNYVLDTLDLSRVRTIPDDAHILLSVGAQNRYEPYEQELLRNYMTNKAGRLMLFSSPGIASTGLEDLLREWGILADNVMVFDPSSNAQTDYSGDLILSSFTPHPVTRILIDNQLLLRFGAARAMRPNPNHASDPGLAVTPLVLTSPTAWGERDYLPRRNQRFDPGADLPGPFAVATAAERVPPKNDLPFSVPVGRLVAFGCSDFVANGRLRAGANNVVFFSSLNWLTGSDKTVSAPARPIEKFQLALSRDQLTRLRYMLLFGAPSAFALFGLLVYWTRRR